MHSPGARLGVGDALFTEGFSQGFRSAEENSYSGIWVLTRNCLELIIPVGPSIQSLLFQACDHVFLLIMVHSKMISLRLIPASEVDIIAEEVGVVPLLHLGLQQLQQVCKPLKGMCVPAQPVEVDLKEG